MTAPVPEPRTPLWLPCDRCGRAGAPSEIDARLCAVCLPHPEVARGRAAEVDRRLALARHAANQPATPEVHTPVPPDAEHIWLPVRGRPVAHLFLDDEATSYCGRAWLGRRAKADVDLPVPEDAKACKACWRVYRAGRRGS